MKHPAMACCWTEDGENVCCLPHGHDSEHVFTGRCNHTDQPTGYREWHSWAKKKSKTHKQVKCPYCGLWSIWIIDTKKSAKSAASTRRTTKGTAKGACRTGSIKRELRNVRYF